MTANDSQEENIRILGELIRNIPVAMLTTAGGNDGSLRSRPMVSQQKAFDGNLWFFTRGTTPMANEILHGQQVNVCYVDANTQLYVSISGLAHVVRDLAEMERVWSPVYETWFPHGLRDPELILLRVEVQQAEYWDSGSSRAGEPLFFTNKPLGGVQAV